MATGISEPQLTLALKKAWHGWLKPPKWPCMCANTHDGVNVSYYAIKQSVICKAVKSYSHALIIYRELQLAALRAGVRIRFEDREVSSVMSVLDLGLGADSGWLAQDEELDVGGVEKGSKGRKGRTSVEVLKINTFMLERHFMVKHDPDVISSIWLRAGARVWILWLRGKFVIPGLRTMRAAEKTISENLYFILQACDLAPLSVAPLSLLRSPSDAADDEDGDDEMVPLSPLPPLSP